MTTSLIFDRVAVSQIKVQQVLPGGALFKAKATNIGEGRRESATVFAEVGNSEIASLEATGKPVEDWLAANITRTANSHQNDGNKIRELVARGLLRYDARYLLD